MFAGEFFIFLVCLSSFLIPSFICPEKIFCDDWLKVEVAEGELVWIDTSHWEKQPVYIKDGYYRDTVSERWVDTSYAVTQGYWKTGEYKVWVVERETVPHTAYRYIDTSRWETRYREVQVLTPVNFTIYRGTDSYGWSVYAFAAKPAGLRQVTYNGETYMAEVWTIDYRPYRGGWIHAEKWVYRYKFITQRQYYSEWVQSGYWQAYTYYEIVDTSHWETRTGRYWVDTSYTVSQGYWEEYVSRQWVDTSYYEYRNVWVSDGYYTSPIHGKVFVEKNPKYVFTRWHKDSAGNDCCMVLKIGWEIDNSQIKVGEEAKRIVRASVYEEVVRYKNKGIYRVDIFDGSFEASSSGSVNTVIKFDFAGNEESILHIYLFSQDGQAVHVYFSNPINGFRSINIDYGGTNTDADGWLGGNNYGEVIF
ncbi:MAG: hypothetical protein FJW69_02970 [Actinobacteria bacterium]|nr:hypothetical protein [Actinomycetota bacterium]